MRTFARLALLFFGVLGLGEFFTCFDLQDTLSPEMAKVIGNLGVDLAILALPPCIIFYPATSSAGRRLCLRAIVAVLLAWLLALEFRMTVELPAMMTLAAQRGDMYDGVGMNAGMLLLGWFPPLIVTLIAIACLPMITTPKQTRTVMICLPLVIIVFHVTVASVNLLLPPTRTRAAATGQP